LAAIQQKKSWNTSADVMGDAALKALFKMNSLKAFPRDTRGHVTACDEQQKINFIVERTTSTTRQDEPALNDIIPKNTQGYTQSMETHIRSFSKR
jgi:hypothetical protein